MFSPGGSVSPINPNKSLTTEKYADESVTMQKLGGPYRFKSTQVGADVNTILTEGFYMVSKGALNNPFNDATFLIVEDYGTRFIKTIRLISDVMQEKTRGGSKSLISSIG